MRRSVPSVARDAARLCTRCRLRAQSSPLGPSETWLSKPKTQASRPLYGVFTRRAFSQSRRVAAPADSAESQQSSSISESPPAAAATPPRTHYDLFPETLPSGPPPAGHFPIDARALRREFLRLQARAHPDLHPPEHKARAEATSSLINEAYRTLANPLLRAQYLLSLRGVDVANDETLKVEEPDLLMMVLEAREEIEDAEEETDLEGPRKENDARVAASEEVLERAFHDDNVEAAKREAVRLRYWINIKESLDNWEKGKPMVLQH